MNKTETKKIMDRLKLDYEILIKEGYEVVGVFLAGSQNYELQYEGSDIDTKAIVLPSFNDFVLNNKAVSFTKILESNEHIDIKDIRLMFDCFKKQNINFVEILFTKYKIMNPKYEALFKVLFDKNEEIARYNNYASMNCICGMSMEKYKALEHPYPATLTKIEKFGYDPKQSHHILRLNEFIKRYVSGEVYSKCLISKERLYLIDVKRGLHTLEEARLIARTLVSDTQKIKNDYMASNPLVINKNVHKMLNDVTVEIMKLNFKTEISKEG